MSTLAVIPARGGSKRLPGKNLRLLGGKPLICHTVEAVLESDIFDLVVISTDSEEIAKAVGSYPVTFHKRPEKYATDEATVLDAMLQSMEDIPRHDIFAYFLPTCPFRSAIHILYGMGKLIQEVDSVVSVTKYSEPIQLAMSAHGRDFVPVFDNLRIGHTNSRVMQQHYRPNGGFYMSWWDKLEKNRSFFKGIVRGYEMQKWNSLDIDDIYDLQVAEFLLGREYELAGKQDS